MAKTVNAADTWTALASSLEGGDIAVDDWAMVINNVGGYGGLLFADDSGDAEDSPKVIKPVVDPGNKRWKLSNLAVDDLYVYGDLDGVWASSAEVIAGNETRKVISPATLQFAIDTFINPIGMVADFAMEDVPSRWLECDGSAVSRTTYSALFTAIGTIHGIGNGSTTFNLPDCRGFYRSGWNHGTENDPDARGRTEVGGSGIMGDHVGTFQKDQNKAHTHSITTRENETMATTVAGATATGGASSANTNSSGGTYARGRNIAFLVCIYTGV